MNKRFLLAIGLFFLFFIIWAELGKRFDLLPKPKEAALDELIENRESQPELESFGEEPAEAVTEAALLEDGPEAIAEPIAAQEIVLENDVIRLRWSNDGGAIISAELKNFYRTAKRRDFIQLAGGTAYYPGELVFEDGRGTRSWRYQVTQNGRDEVVFTYKRAKINVVKRFRLGTHYDLEAEVEVTGQEAMLLVVNDGLQPILPGESVKPSLLSFGAINPKYMEITWSENGDHESKYPGDLDETSFKPLLKKEQIIVWAGMKDSYFATIFLSERPLTNVFVKGTPTPSLKIEQIPTVALKVNGGLKGRFYMGPQLERELAEMGGGVDNVISYGWAGLLSKGLFYLLKICHTVTGNWGWAIVLLTILIKIVMFPLMVPSIKSSYKMRELAPKMERLKQKYSSKDMEAKQKLNQEMFKLYKEEGINPFSSCLTAVAQMPVFFAYFSLLRTSISLRQADWLFWINDLSVKDPYYVLPIIMTVTMFLSMQSMSMPSADPLQQKMMKFMPIVFSLFFLAMPSGLIIYMITANIFTLGQTYILKRRFQKP